MGFVGSALCSALMAMLFWSAPVASAESSSRSNTKILAFGDSLTSGVGGAGEDYPSRLAQLLGFPVINAGLPGEVTSEGRRRLPHELERERPSLLILCLGLNDLMRKIDPAEVRDNLVAMMRSAQERGIPVLLLAVPPLGSARAHPLYAEAALLGGAELDDQSMVAVLSNPRLKADLVHPNRDGYREVADHVARRMRGAKLLGRDSPRRFVLPARGGLPMPQWEPSLDANVPLTFGNRLNDERPGAVYHLPSTG